MAEATVIEQLILNKEQPRAQQGQGVFQLKKNMKKRKLRKENEEDIGDNRKMSLVHFF